MKSGRYNLGIRVKDGQVISVRIKRLGRKKRGKRKWKDVCCEDARTFHAALSEFALRMIGK